MDRVAKFICIPIEIWENKELSWAEKALLFEVDSYTQSGKECYFSDEYLADFLNCSVPTAKRMLKKLFDMGLIKKRSFDGRKRYIESTLSYGILSESEKNDTAGSKKMIQQVGQIDPVLISIYCNNTPKESDNKLSSSLDPQEGKKSKKFVKPCVEDVKAFCLANELLYVNPDEFVDFYESKGWRVGNSPMKDWKAAARRWNRTNKARPYAKPQLEIPKKEEAEHSDWRQDHHLYGLEDFEKNDPYEFSLLLPEMQQDLREGKMVLRRNGLWEWPEDYPDYEIFK